MPHKRIYKTHLCEFSWQFQPKAIVAENLDKESALTEKLNEMWPTNLNPDLIISEVSRQCLDVADQNLGVLITVVQDVCRLELAVGLGHVSFLSEASVVEYGFEERHLHK